MTQTYGPFAAGAGLNLGQDPYLDYLGPMLQGDGVNTTVFGGSTLQVYGNSSGMQVLMRAGSALIRGGMYNNTADVALTIAASTSSPRIDRVVLRSDRGHSGGGQTYPFVITGTPASSPVPPAITQAVGGVWDITLAQVNVGASVSGINPGDVADERQYLPLLNKVCDTRYPSQTPPVDGSQGRVFYDKNPAVLDQIVTNGASWAQVRGPSTYDSGWVDVAVDAGEHWVGQGLPTGIQVRKCGNLVEVLIAVQATGAVGTPQVCTLPSQYRPLIGRAYPLGLGSGDAVIAGSTGGLNAELLISPAGVVVISAGYDLGGSRLSIVPGWSYTAQALYIAG